MIDLSREHEYWSPEPTFAGQTVFCLASGPSLTPEICGKVRGRPTIVVNCSYALAPWATVLYFTDGAWYEGEPGAGPSHREVVAEWPGMVVAMARAAKIEHPGKVKRIRTVGDPDLPCEFPAVGSGTVRQGRTSGHTAISLAIAMAASRVVMLGYDCRVVDGREHHHNEYLGPRENNRREYSTVFVPAYAGWNAAARRLGVEILNATAGSAIAEFPFVNLDDIL